MFALTLYLYYIFIYIIYVKLTSHILPYFIFKLIAKECIVIILFHLTFWYLHEINIESMKLQIHDLITFRL